MYLLEYKHEKVLASDDKSLKMNHATFALDSAATTPSSGKKTRWSDLAKLYFAVQKVVPSKTVPNVMEDDGQGEAG